MAIHQERYGLVTNHWIEPDSHNLSYARVQVLDRHLPVEGMSNTLRDLSVSTDNNYTVISTRMGSVPVYSAPEMQAELLVGSLRSRSVVTALEHRGDWIRHGTGWSLRHSQGNCTLYTVHCQRRDDD